MPPCWWGPELQSSDPGNSLLTRAGSGVPEGTGELKEFRTRSTSSQEAI